jgi:lysophospholipase L1-like esterase
MAMGIYVALGDSISIDDYTGVRGGGAASQFARMLALDLVDLTRDGNTTHGVLSDLARVPARADVVTLTDGGNDLLGGDFPRAILRGLIRSSSGYTRSTRVCSSTRSTTRATATTPSDAGSSGSRGWRRSSSDGA